MWSLRRLSRSWDILGVILLILSSLPSVWISPRSLGIVGSPAPTDDSWIVDMVFKASHGIWIGRDVAFTFGPLLQWLSSVPARSVGVSMGAIFPTYGTLPLWCGLVLSWIALRLLLSEQPPWKRLVLFLLVNLFWSTLDLRPYVNVFVFSVFLSGWYAVSNGVVRSWLAALAAALLSVASFLVSPDTGVYAVAILIVTWAGVALEFRRQRSMLRRLALALVQCAGFLLVLTVAINAWAATPFDFRFWKISLALAGTYRWFEPLGMSKPGKVCVVAALVTGLLVFALRAFFRSSSNASLTARPGFLLSGALFAFLALQSGLVRSDIGHVYRSIFPAIFLMGCIAFALRGRLQWVIVPTVVAASALLASPQPALLPTNIAGYYSQNHHPLMSCPADLEEFDRACFTPQFVQGLESASAFLKSHTDPAQAVVVFPYQSIYGVAAQRNVAGGLLQAYQANGKLLSQVELQGLENSDAPAGLYLPEGPLSPAIDGVPNFTRTPEVWFWFLRHYRAASQPSPGIWALIRRDPAFQGLGDMQVIPLAMESKYYPVRQRHSQLELGSVSWPPEGADFLRLQMRVNYPFWWKIRKPERIQLEISYDNGQRALKTFVLPPNTDSEVWFYPWDESDLIRFFGPDDDWRTRRPAVSSLRLLTSPYDWVSVVPDSVFLERAEAVRLTSANANNGR